MAGMDDVSQTMTGLKKSQVPAPSPEAAWGINGHQNDAFNNHRANASSNATHAGILASQAPMTAPLAKPNMLTKPGSTDFVRPN